MKRTHFPIPFWGNKRKECNNIIEQIDFDGIETIIEPFCGSSAISCFISKLYPKRFKYILNDMDTKLIELYKIIQNEDLINKFNLNMNLQITFFNKCQNMEKRKEYYAGTSYYFKKKYYEIRPTLCPNIENTKKLKEFNLRDFEIYNFLKNENVSMFNIDGLDIIESNKNDDSILMLLDPPYINTNNSTYNYSIKSYNVYEYFSINDICEMECKMMFILEDNWIIRMLFKKAIFSSPYQKLYETVGKKKTQHIIIKNR